MTGKESAVLLSLAHRAGSDIGAMRYITRGFLVSEQQGGVAHAPDSSPKSNSKHAGPSEIPFTSPYTKREL
jgi:hypothetical protein